MSNNLAVHQPAIIAGLLESRLESFRAREAERFVAARPRSRAALKAGAAPWLDGVPMHWMRD